jgi:glycosyltransferase involved in cell wall biosynthesis
MNRAGAYIPPRLGIVVSFSGTGGVEGNMCKLIPALLETGVAVDLLGIFKTPVPPPLQFRHPRFRLIDLGVKHSLLIVPALMRYLQEHPITPLLVAKDRAIRSAIVARALSATRNRLVGQLNTNLSAALAERSTLQRFWRTWPMRWFYPHIDAVVCVSQGVAEDTHQLTGLPMDRLPVIRNPVIDADLYEKSREPLDHPWFQSSDAPLILGAGRLTRQKDFPTLIRAFARLRSERSCRLAILGEGPDRDALTRLVQTLGLADDVLLPGHVDNPFAWMAKSRLFVLSSCWEGSGNVLTEAMALGIPVVSTDCPSGPSEMLAGGLHGPLVPVGDEAALAEAMTRTLKHPQPAEFLQHAVREYRADVSARRYLKILGITALG